MFQVILLAGGTGSRIYPLAEVQPKALLPIANRPLIYYPLKLLGKYGFRNIIVVTNVMHREKMHNYLQDFEDKDSLVLDLVAVNAEMETADVLRQIQDRIHSDFFVIAGDLVTDAVLHQVAETHWLNDAFLTVLLHSSSSSDSSDAALIDYIGLDEKKLNLLFLASAADVDDKMSLHKTMLKRFPNIMITKKLRDSHFYIFSRDVLTLLAAKKKITSIKDELIPYLIKKQFSKNPLPGLERIKCVAYIHSEGICRRVNSLSSYREANFEVAKGAASDLTPWELPPRSTDSKSIGPDCLVINPTIGERSLIKHSIIGPQCQIGAGVKINNCVIMDHVVIHNKANISNCILSGHVNVQEGITLVSCTVADTTIVDHDSKNEVLTRE